VLYGNSSGGVISLFSAPVRRSEVDGAFDAGSFGLRQWRVGGAGQSACRGRKRALCKHQPGGLALIQVNKRRDHRHVPSRRSRLRWCLLPTVPRESTRASRAATSPNRRAPAGYCPLNRRRIGSSFASSSRPRRLIANCPSRAMTSVKGRPLMRRPGVSLIAGVAASSG